MMTTQTKSSETVALECIMPAMSCYFNSGVRKLGGKHNFGKSTILQMQHVQTIILSCRSIKEMHDEMPII